jgi:Diadenosine tetraphosphate (Ap4A) hydrolase and other HIT family hydrolases
MTRDHTHCTFCNLIHGAAEVSICHEDADAIAFMDIQPVNNGHVLVVPREHYESLLEVPEELGVHLFKVTMRLAAAVRTVSGTDALNIVVNSGAEAGQDEPHYHVHIIPRRQGDGFDIPLPFDGSQMPDRTILDAYAARVIAALRDPVRATAEAGGFDAPQQSRERQLAVPTYRESPARSSTPSQAPALVEPPAEGTRRSSWRISEGPHGELRYEPNADTDGAS